MDLLSLAALRVRYLGLEVGEATRCAIERDMGLQEMEQSAILTNLKPSDSRLLCVFVDELEQSLLSPQLALDQGLHHCGRLAPALVRQAALGLCLVSYARGCLSDNSTSVNIFVVFGHFEPKFTHATSLYFTQGRL